MTCDEVMAQLRKLGTEQTRKTWIRHGATEPMFGVKVGDLKPIQKKIKVDYDLALELYATGNVDAMYLAGLITDDSRMTKKDLQSWVNAARCPMLSEYAVPWVAAGSRFGWELGLKWIESRKESVAASGWSTLSGIVAIQDDAELDLAKLEVLLWDVTRSIHAAPNRVRYAMNFFVISVGCYVEPLTTQALAAAQAIGKVTCDMGDTACKVPDATDYILKVKSMGRVGRKRKTVKC